MKKTKILFMPVLFILFALAGQFSSCEPEDWSPGVDCNDCFGYRPDSADLIIYVTINKENPYVPLEIYRGSDEGELMVQDTAISATFYFWAATGQAYTVRARYRQDSGWLDAYDGDIMKIRDFGEQCGDPCYIIKGGTFDLTLAGP